MLLDIRHTLYDGSWRDFKKDLQARAESKPHVFETVPATADMVETIHSHLALIDQMWRWESQHGETLSNRVREK